MISRTQVVETHPDFPWLASGQTESIRAFLLDHAWIQADERIIACGKAGEGNMNLTLRIVTENRSFILKQARPWVEKYEHISAPWDRILYEQGFYQRVRSIPAVAAAMPSLIASDAHARVIVLEDLGTASDFSRLYSGAPLSEPDRNALAEYLAALHTATHNDADPEFVNREMRLLNHEHMFVVPLAEDNGLDLEPYEPGLAESAKLLRSDTAFIHRVQKTGERYLADGPCLLHGDYFPGSWLQTPEGVRIIDPEFTYYGDPEFDLGVCLAHFRLAKRPLNEALAFLDSYRSRAHGIDLQERWIARYASIEIMRRILGVAQLPIAPTVDFRRELLAHARGAMRMDALETLWS